MKRRPRTNDQYSLRTRQKVSQLTRWLGSGRVSPAQYAAACGRTAARFGRDEAADLISCVFYEVMDDVCDYTLTEPIESWRPFCFSDLRRKAAPTNLRRDFARAVLFLHSDQEFESGRHADEDHWPFASKAECDRARAKPVLLAGRRP